MVQETTTRWKSVKRGRGYQPQPVAAVPTQHLFPERAARAGLCLQVNSRDPPRESGGREGARFTQAGNMRENGGNVRRGAWNPSFFAFSRGDVSGLLPTNGAGRNGPDALFQRLVREQLVGNVRGQNDHWQDHDLREAFLRVERVSRLGPLSAYGIAGLSTSATANAPFGGIGDAIALENRP